MNILKQIRLKRGLTQEQLAQLVPLKAGGCHISRIERGIPPNRATAERIAAALNEKPETVFPNFSKLRGW